jgi:hypothetical protein
MSALVTPAAGIRAWVEALRSNSRGPFPLNVAPRGAQYPRVAGNSPERLRNAREKLTNRTGSLDRLTKDSGKSNI